MKKKKKQKEGNIKTKICNALEISSDILTDVLRFTINGNSEMWVENYKGVLEYESGQIRLAAKNYEVKIMGEGLEIACITDEQVFIKGSFFSLEYVY